jgi:DivIVA domain-containing protein
MRDDLRAYEVQEMVFSKPPMGKRGYNEDEVDAFVSEVVARLEGRGRLTAEEVRDVAFSKPALFKRGYNEDEVDAFLEDAEATIARMDRRR